MVTPGSPKPATNTAATRKPTTTTKLRHIMRMRRRCRKRSCTLLLLCLVIAAVTLSVVVSAPRILAEIPNPNVTQMRKVMNEYKMQDVNVTCDPSTKYLTFEERLLKKSDSEYLKILTKYLKSVQRVDGVDVEKEVNGFEEIASKSAENFTRHSYQARSWLLQSTARWPKYKSFLPVMPPEDWKVMVTLFQTFDLACRAANLTYFLCGGTLLGAWRHRGMIPWDDDLDIVLFVEDMQRAMQVLSCLPGYDMAPVDPKMAHWKFFATPGRLPVNPQYPGMDVFFCTSDEHYIWTLTDYEFNRLVYAKNDVFPLSSRDFEGFPVSVPGKFETAVKKTFDPLECVSSDHNHMWGMGASGQVSGSDVKKAKCQELDQMYPIYTTDSGKS